MNFDTILNEVETSKWQPKFKWTKDLNDVVKHINLGHEDYPINIPKTKELIEELIQLDYHSINWNIAQQIQQKLFNSKLDIIDKGYWVFTDTNGIKKPFTDFQKMKNFSSKVSDRNETYSSNYINFENLPSLYIKLGIRDKDVKVGSWIPPKMFYLVGLIEQIFPVKIEGTVLESNPPKCLVISGLYNKTLFLNHWYKIFQTIHPFNDLNGRVGGIIIAVLSYIAYGEYLTLDKD